VHFLEHGEFHIIGELAKILNLMFGFWVLIAKIIGGEPQNNEALIFKIGIKLLQTLKLGGIATIGCGIHYQYDFAGIRRTQIHLLIAGQFAHRKMQ
jgi:hypothetical protein